AKSTLLQLWSQSSIPERVPLRRLRWHLKTGENAFASSNEVVLQTVSRCTSRATADCGVRDSELQQFGKLHTPYTENELPQPQLPVAFGLLKVKPEPITEFT